MKMITLIKENNNEIDVNQVIRIPIQLTLTL